MKWRCYLCTYTLGESIPPLEALSQGQAGVVGGVHDAASRFTTLEGTPFEGMSTYSFCEFCLTYIRDYFGAWNVPGHVINWTMDEQTYKSLLLCECGEKYVAPSHVLGARWAIQHHVKVTYSMNWASVDAVLPLDWGMKYGKYNDCDWCNREGVAARGLGDESTGGHVLTICEECDHDIPSTPQWTDLNEEEPF